MMTRRDLMRTALGTAATAALPAVGRTADVTKGFTLPPLPYPADALEPSIDAETMTIHHDKHHATYVTKLNEALTAAAPDWLGKTIDEVMTGLDKVPEKIRTAVRNNGGGHWNHTFFWSVMAKLGTGGEPKGELLKAIDASFGTLDGFKKEFAAAAASQFGSGWAWLVPGKEKPLAVVASANQDNPVMTGVWPVLGIDVWEHAYYLKYRNLRPKYVEAFFTVANWNAAAERFDKAKRG